MRRTLSVVLTIVTFYNVKTILQFLTLRRKVSIAGRWFKNAIVTFRTPFNQENFPLSENHLPQNQHSKRSDSASNLPLLVSVFSIFDYYKPINRNCHETDAFNRSYHCYLLQC
jgi:hypothetical protein